MSIVDRIVAAAGGHAHVARQLGLKSTPVVSMWARRGRIPSWHRPAVRKLLADLGTLQPEYDEYLRERDGG